jgi:DNA repair protein RadC
MRLDAATLSPVLSPSLAPAVLVPLPIPAVPFARRSAPPGVIKDWPAAERPREKLNALGLRSLSDSELLALFVRTGIPGRTAVDIGRTLIERFGSLGELLGASQTTLKTIKGLGPAKIAQLRAISELVRRSLTQHMERGPALDSPSAVGDYLQLMIGNRPYEVFVSLYLDVHYRLIRAEESSRGTLTQTSVYPREIAREAMHLNAAALIVAHNHPSGAVLPSDADRLLTQRLKSTLDLVDVRLLDHFIVSTTDRLSFSERGWL